MFRSLRGLAVLPLLAFLCVTISGRESSARAAANKPDDSADIRAVMDIQVAAWNAGDVDTFMQSYWKSDETVFVGAKGLVRGYQAVLARYHRDYPDRKAMGRLAFSNLEIHMVCSDAAFVIGQFHLKREYDQPEGIFTLDFRKFPEGWRIVADHTTGFAAIEPVKSK
jgi:ketosteroid isomerase-like protein